MDDQRQTTATVAYGLPAAEIERRSRIDAYLKQHYDRLDKALAEHAYKPNRAERRHQGMKRLRRSWVRGRGSAWRARARLKLAMRRYAPDGHSYRDGESEVRLRWDRARPNLGLYDEVVLDLSLWAVQRAELDKAPNRWPSDYEAPPRSSLRDISALIHAPRPGPLAGTAQAA